MTTKTKRTDFIQRPTPVEVPADATARGEAFAAGYRAKLQGCFRVLVCPESDHQRREWLAGYDAAAQAATKTEGWCIFTPPVKSKQTKLLREAAEALRALGGALRCLERGQSVSSGGPIYENLKQSHDKLLAAVKAMPRVHWLSYNEASQGLTSQVRSPTPAAGTGTKTG